LVTEQLLAAEALSIGPDQIQAGLEVADQAGWQTTESTTTQKRFQTTVVSSAKCKAWPGFRHC
jgi:hypothetical protein